jgi:hypothetical protein
MSKTILQQRLALEKLSKTYLQQRLALEMLSKTNLQQRLRSKSAVEKYHITAFSIEKWCLKITLDRAFT